MLSCCNCCGWCTSFLLIFFFLGRDCDDSELLFELLPRFSLLENFWVMKVIHFSTKNVTTSLPTAVEWLVENVSCMVTCWKCLLYGDLLKMSAVWWLVENVCCRVTCCNSSYIIWFVRFCHVSCFLTIVARWSSIWISAVSIFLLSL